jgi:hypothetical protein
MSRKYIKIGIAAAVLLVIGAVVAYQFIGGKEYSTDMAELRAKFNGDKGKVRLLVLLSPT